MNMATNKERNPAYFNARLIAAVPEDLWRMRKENQFHAKKRIPLIVPFIK